MWADKEGNDVAIVKRNTGYSLLPPIFFQVKLSSRPYDITITDGGRIQSVLEGGLGHKLGIQRHDHIVGLGTKGKINNYVVDYLTTSQRVVNEILRLPADDTCMLIARGDDFHPFVGDASADSANAISFSQEANVFL